jgi:hypothetical protein
MVAILWKAMITASPSAAIALKIRAEEAEACLVDGHPCKGYGCWRCTREMAQANRERLLRQFETHADSNGLRLLRLKATRLVLGTDLNWRLRNLRDAIEGLAASKTVCFSPSASRRTVTWTPGKGFRLSAWIIGIKRGPLLKKSIEERWLQLLLDRDVISGQPHQSGGFVSLEKVFGPAAMMAALSRVGWPGITKLRQMPVDDILSYLGQRESLQEIRWRGTNPALEPPNVRRA